MKGFLWAYLGVNICFLVIIPVFMLISILLVCFVYWDMGVWYESINNAKKEESFIYFRVIFLSIQALAFVMGFKQYGKQ